MFTKEIWGDSVGYRFVFTGKPGAKGMGKKAFEDNETAHDYALRQSQAGLNVWYGVAVYIDGGKKTQTNVKELRAFWLDIDIGKPGCYGNLEEAVTGVISFYEKYGLPLPTLISSGYGLHVYWLLTEAIPKLEWDKLAKALKRIVKAHGLKVDNGLTADSARLLRLPGTLNYKNPTAPQPVKILGDGNKTTLENMRRVLGAYVEDDTAKAVNDVFISNMPSLPSDAGKVAEGCAQMRTVRDARGNVQEPLWYAAIGVLAYCEEGETLVHEYSNGYPKYTPTETSDRLERRKSYPPTLCEKFNDVNPAGCAGCPFNGKISTPVQIGQMVTAITTPPAPVSFEAKPVGIYTNGDEVNPFVQAAIVAEPQASSDYPAPPAGYEVGLQGVWRKDEEEGRLIPICPIPIFVVAHRQSRAGAEVELVWRTPLGAECRGCMPMENFADKKKLAGWLYMNAITGFRNPDEMKLYLEAGQLALAKRTELTRQYDHFGWDSDNFVLGDRLLTPVAIGNAALSNRIPQSIVDGFKAKGNQEAWAEATAILNRAGLWAHRFTVLAILGAPLLKLMGWSGAMLSLASHESGTGKTTATRLGLAAYSRYHSNEIAPESTDKAIYEHLYLAHNLPVFIDESSTIDKFKVSKLVYAAVNGQARRTLTRNSELRESEQWANLTVLASNIHITSLPDKFLNEANRFRILELTLGNNLRLDKAEAKAIYNAIETNYGKPGETYLAFVVSNRPAIVKELGAASDKYGKVLPGECRFMVWLIAVAEVGGKIAKGLGLIRFDIDDAIANAVTTAADLALQIKGDGDKVADIIADYINANNGYFTRFFKANKTPWVDEPIRGEIAGRFTHENNGKLSVALASVKLYEYLTERGIDRQTFKNWAEAQGATFNVSVLLSPGQPLVRCTVLPMPNEQGGSQ